MRANRAYRLILTRAGRAPALLADATRVDHVEVVEIVAQRAGKPGGGVGRAVPEEHGFAAVDLDYLDMVDAIGVGEQSGCAPGTGEDQPVGAIGPHEASRM